jgi:hypothetical protein
MKKAIILCGLFFSFFLVASAQSANSKTDLSLAVSNAAGANRAQLMNYTWTRTVQVFISGELKSTSVSAMSFGPDGKMVTTAVSTSPTSAPKRGLRGDIAESKTDDMKDYVQDAITISMGYIYMSKGKMVDYFNAAGISQSGNTITVSGSNVNKPNDQMTMTLASGSLAYISQNFKSTVTSGDAMSGAVNYKTFSNGLTAVNDGELDLPAKNMKLMFSNSNYAQKVQ